MMDKSDVQYCEKVMRAKCANFVLCPCEVSTKFRSKIRALFRDVPSVISLKQREKIRRIFETSAKIRSKNKGRKFAAFSRPSRKTKSVISLVVPKFRSVVCKDRSHIDRLFSFVNNCSHFDSTLMISTCILEIVQ